MAPGCSSQLWRGVEGVLTSVDASHSAGPYSRGNCGKLWSMASRRWGLTVECHCLMDTAHREPHYPGQPGTGLQEEALDASWQLKEAGACLQVCGTVPDGFLESSSPSTWTPTSSSPAAMLSSCLHHCDVQRKRLTSDRWEEYFPEHLRSVLGRHSEAQEGSGQA